MPTKQMNARQVNAPNADEIFIAPGEYSPDAFPEIALGTIILLPPERLAPTKNQPRSEIEMEAVEELAANVADLRERGLGIAGTGFIDAIKVRLPPGVVNAQGEFMRHDFQLPIYSGETRWHAAHRAKSPLVPVSVEDLSEDDALELAYYANTHRRDFKPMDEARFLLHLKNKHKLSVRGLGRRVRKNKDTVQGLISLALPGAEDVQSIVTANPKSLTLAQRINTIKNPGNRTELIERAKAGESFDKLYPVVQRYREAERDGSSTIGTPKKKGVRVVARFNLDNALDSLLRQAGETHSAMKDATMPADYRRKLRGKASELRVLAAAMEESLQPPATRKEQNKK